MIHIALGRLNWILTQILHTLSTKIQLQECCAIYFRSNMVSKFNAMREGRGRDKVQTILARPTENMEGKYTCTIDSKIPSIVLLCAKMPF